MSYTPVTPDRWGDDHWAMFAHIETNCVNSTGSVNPVPIRGADDWAEPSRPTELKNRDSLQGHNGIDVIGDLISAGLVDADAWHASGRVWEEQPSDSWLRRFIVEYGRFKITWLGWVVSGWLRQHRAEGGTYATFAPVMSNHWIISRDWDIPEMTLVCAAPTAACLGRYDEDGKLVSIEDTCNAVNWFNAVEPDDLIRGNLDGVSPWPVTVDWYPDGPEIYQTERDT